MNSSYLKYLTCESFDALPSAVITAREQIAQRKAVKKRRAMRIVRTVLLSLLALCAAFFIFMMGAGWAGPTALKGDYEYHPGFMLYGFLLFIDFLFCVLVYVLTRPKDGEISFMSPYIKEHPGLLSFQPGVGRWFF